MADKMDIERFRKLAESYGAAIERWPEAVRRTARITAESFEAQDIIKNEKALDGMLDLWSTPVLSTDFVRRTDEKVRPSHQKVGHSVRLWWTSIAIATALSGAMTGSAASALIWQVPQSYTSTVFGDLYDGDN